MEQASNQQLQVKRLVRDYPHTPAPFCPRCWILISPRRYKSEYILYKVLQQ